MQMNDRVLARRYALAFYQTASAGGEAQSAAEEIAKAARAVSANMSSYGHPRVSTEEKKSRLRSEIGSGVSKRTLRFLELLIEKKRFALLPAIAADFARVYDDGRGVAHASVRSARPLDDSENKILSDRLGRFAGKTVVLDVKVVPELLAGVVVRLGDWVIDGSLKGKLRTLRGRLAA